MDAGAKNRQGRRTWTAAARARIVAESFAAGAMVNVVARRHGINPSQLSQWRRESQANRGGSDASAQAGTTFVPVTVAGTPVAPVVLNRAAHAQPGTGEIEIARGELTVRMRGVVDPAMLMAVLQALVGPS
jgi:transposase